MRRQLTFDWFILLGVYGYNNKYIVVKHIPLLHSAGTDIDPKFSL